ncbi:MAG: hypothetical protein MUE32_11840 [Bacteroidales bacterium]|nr:hypothetical protein [Bacteroidales bacterium]
MEGLSGDDSTAIIRDYINKWARRELMLQKAEDNLTPEVQKEIERQTADTRKNLVIYEYQRRMMLERMDTVISETEMESYYSSNEQSFMLASNIVKALYIKLPVETPDLDRIRNLARSNSQNDLQQLETICYQFAEEYDDFNDSWITLDKLLAEFSDDIGNEENFLRRTSFYENTDSSSVFFVSIRDYRLRSSVAPYEYVKDDIKRIIWNNRRLEYIRSLENGIYNDALKKNSFKILR